MWSLMWLSPELPDKLGGQEHHSKQIPTTRLQLQSETIILVKLRCDGLSALPAANGEEMLYFT